MTAQLLAVLRCYIVIDLIGHYMRSSAYGQGVSAPPLLSDSLSRQILFAWLYAIQSYFGLAYGYHICALVAVGIGLTEPALWPSMFGSFTEAYTMRKVWGKRHSLIPCHLHANKYISRVLLASVLSEGKADSGLLEAFEVPTYFDSFFKVHATSSSQSSVSQKGVFYRDMFNSTFPSSYPP
jgi:hypothetical protein